MKQKIKIPFIDHRVVGNTQKKSSPRKAKRNRDKDQVEEIPLLTLTTGQISPIMSSNGLTEMITIVVSTVFKNMNQTPTIPKGSKTLLSTRKQSLFSITLAVTTTTPKETMA